MSPLIEFATFCLVDQPVTIWHGEADPTPGFYHHPCSFKELALYTRKTFRDAFVSDPWKRFQVVDDPGPKSLVVEMAITELVPSSPALGALAIGGSAAKKLASSSRLRAWTWRRWRHFGRCSMIRHLRMLRFRAQQGSPAT